SGDQSALVDHWFYRLDDRSFYRWVRSSRDYRYYLSVLIFWGAYVFGVGWNGSDLSLLSWPDLTGGGSLFRTRFRFCRDFRFNFDGRKHHFILRFQWARGCRLGDRSHLVFLPGFPDF